MKFHELLEQLISGSGKPSGNITKIISKLEQGLAREMRKYSSEKQVLLGKAVSLEKGFLRKEFGKAEYYGLKAAVHKKMLLLDLQTSIAEHCFSIIESSSRLTTLKEDEKLVKEKEILSLAEKHMDEFWEAKKLYSSNKITVGEMQEKLRGINSEIVDIEHALSTLCAEANRKEQARAIIAETAEKLGEETEHRGKAAERKTIHVPHHESKVNHIPKAPKKKRRYV